MHKLLLIACLFLTCNADAQLVQRRQVLMGTFVSISIDEKHKKFMQPSFTILKKIETSLSSYKDYTLPYNAIKLSGFFGTRTSVRALCL